MQEKDINNVVHIYFTHHNSRESGSLVLASQNRLEQRKFDPTQC